FDLNANTQFIVSGLNSPTVADLQIGDQLQLQVNNETTVQKITVKDRNIEAELGLTITFYDEKTGTVLMNKNDKAIVKTIDEQTKVESYGVSVPLASFSTYFQKDRKVDITFTGERLLSISLANRYEGTLTENNISNKTMKLNTSNYGVLSFSYILVPN